MNDDRTIEDLIAASSLGTAEAVAVRASVSDEEAHQCAVRAARRLKAILDEARRTGEWSVEAEAALELASDLTDWWNRRRGRPQVPVVEHAVQMSGGSMHLRNDHPDIERIYPLTQRIPDHQRHGGRVFRRAVIVVEDWAEVSKEEAT